MVQAFFLPTEIVACPTIREADGLAMSSRNVRISEPSRALAPLLYQKLLSRSSVSEAKLALEDQGFRVEYLEELDDRRFVAAWLGNVRLIDNVPVKLAVTIPLERNIL